MKGQTYLTENFEGAFTGNPAAPAGWTQTRLVMLGDGIPDPGTGEKDWERIVNTGPAAWTYTWTTPGVQPLAAFSGSAVLAINSANFGGLTAALGNRRMETPVVNLAAATSPYVRFRMFNAFTPYFSNLRVMASNNGGATWQSIMVISPNTHSTVTMSSLSPWDRINVLIPANFLVSNAKFGIEVTNTGGTANIFIDDFSIEEFTPTTITSAQSGNWSNPATWVGGIVPNCDHHVVIAATHTVTNDMQIVRTQNLTVDGAITYTSTSTLQNHNHIFGNLTVGATGTFSSCLTTTGKRTYVGGNFVNNGNINFMAGTSTSGALNLVGYSAVYSGTGTVAGGGIPQVGFFTPAGTSFSNPLQITFFAGLYEGVVNATNLSLGGHPTSQIHTLERYAGSFLNVPTFNPAGVSRRDVRYITPISTANPGAFYYTRPAVTVIPGNENESSAGTFSVTGFLTMNTYDNVQLSYPLTVGTTTGGGLTLTRGIIITSTTNILTYNTSNNGAAGINPSTIVCNGTNTGGTHGSFVVGPIRAFMPATGTLTKNYPLGGGTAFHNNLPSSNFRRQVSLAPGTTGWGTQTVTATMENAPSGSANAPVTTVLGTRAYRLNMNGGPALPNTAIITMNAINSTFGGSDNLVGNQQDLRIVQAPALSGPWTERSTTLGTGGFVNDVLYSRTSVTTAPGPINNGDEYFAWGSTGTAVDLAATALPSPATVSCYGPNQTVAVNLFNAGIATLNFATNPATINCEVSGAVNFTFAPVVINTGTLAANASQTVNVSTTFNMSTAGVYAFTSTVSTLGDANTVNDIMPVSNRTVFASVPLPLAVDFTGFNGNNLPILFPGWEEGTGANTPSTTASNWNSQTNVNSSGNVTARLNLWLATTHAWITSPKFTAAANSYMTFDAALTAFGSPTNAGILGGDDMLRVMVSTDCGATYTPIFTISATNSLLPTFTNFGINLGAYAGQDIKVAFYGTDGPIDDVNDMDIHIDNINIYNLPNTDAGVTAHTNPPANGCYSNNQSVGVILKNLGAQSITNTSVTVIVSGAISQTLVTTYTPSIPSMGTVSIPMGVINMTTPGTYSFTSFSTLTGDAIAQNDTNKIVRNVAPILSLPQSVGFNGFNGNNLPVINTGWFEAQGITSFTNTAGSNWVNNIGLGAPTNTVARIQLLSASRNDWIVGPKVVATTSTTISFDAAVADLTATYGPATMGSDDRVRLMVSTDCGVSFTPIFTLSAANNLPNTLTNFNVNLSAYNGQEIILAFYATDGPIDDPESYFFYLDNINLYNNVATDGGVTAINTPTVNACLSTNEQIVVTVKNFGLGPISNFPVTAVISGPINSTVTSNFTGTLAPNATASFTIGSANMNVSGTYSLNAFTGVAGDPNTFNDAVVLVTTQSPAFGITGGNVICSSGSQTLTVTGSAVTYTWSNSATTNSIVVTPTSNTTYSAIGTGTNNCQVSAFFTVSVINPTIVSSGTAVCSPTAVATLTANAFGPVSWYASPTATTPLATGNTFTTTAATTTTFYAEANSVSNSSLTTTFAAGNGCGGGTMFDITATNGAVVIDSLDINTSVAVNTTLSVIIYYKTGGYLGNETNAAAWTAWDTIIATSAGANQPTRVPFNLGLNIPNNALHALYVNYNAQYTNGTNAYSNSDITLQMGAGLCSQFGGVNPGRMFNGNVYYSKPGCTSPKIPVTVTVAPTPTLTANSSTNTVCAGTSVTLTASGVDSYTWSTNSNSTTIVVTPTTTSTYTVNGLSNLCNITLTETLNINVNALPTVSLSAAVNTICVLNGSISLNGSPSGGIYSGTAVTGSLLSISNAGTFTPSYSFTNSLTGCSNTATTQVLVFTCTGVDEAGNGISKLSVYPNPNNGSFTIETGNILNKNIEVMDVTGRVVFAASTEAEKILIDVRELANGMYQVKVKTNTGTEIIKVIKQ